MSVARGCPAASASASRSRAPSCHPPILPLDEATSALDARTEAAVGKTIRGVGKGRTVVFITHRLTSVTDMDDIVVMDQGRIVQLTHDELWRRKAPIPGFGGHRPAGDPPIQGGANTSLTIPQPDVSDTLLCKRRHGGSPDARHFLRSQKGGTGKSTLVLNLAVTAQFFGERVVVVDLDAQGTAGSWHKTRKSRPRS